MLILPYERGLISNKFKKPINIEWLIETNAFLVKSIDLPLYGSGETKEEALDMLENEILDIIIFVIYVIYLGMKIIYRNNNAK